MLESIYYAILSLLIILIEKWRIDRIKNIKPNVNHAVSAGIAFGAYVLVLFYCSIWGWHTITYGFICLGIRGVIYDPILNLVLKNPVAYQSLKSNSTIDRLERRFLGENFWVHRSFYFLIFVIAYILYN